MLLGAPVGRQWWPGVLRDGTRAGGCVNPEGTLNFEQNRAVVRWLRRHSELPMVALELWAECLHRADHETGEIVATRDELAATVESCPDDVSRIMSELEHIGAVARTRQKVAGLLGPGRVRYRLNLHVGTCLLGRKQR